jgi:cell division protein FtsI/penicillin-binding protein 2
MKIVTTEALLVKGDDLTTPISCPTDAVVDGKHFHNIEGEGGTQLNLQQAFVVSCNTAFVQLAATLKASELTRAAENLGFNAPEPLPLTSKGSSFPHPKDLADQAGAAIGQAEVLATPLHMASVAAAVASGAWHQPTLTAGASATATVTPLDPGVAGKLRTLMGLVVSDPSGTGILARLPGTPVSGKTGTAEFGNATPPRTHAWFVGFRGNLAFAVLVEGGGVGGKVAAPLAAKFLSQLPG